MFENASYKHMAKSLTNEISVDEIYITGFQMKTYVSNIWRRQGGGDIPTCSRCGCVDVKRHPTQKHQWYCRGCQKNFNVKIGTIFHKTKIGLKYWFIIDCSNVKCKERHINS